MRLQTGIKAGARDFLLTAAVGSPKHNASISWAKIGRRSEVGGWMFDASAWRCEPQFIARIKVM